MKIVVFTDLEGVSGVTSFEDQAAPTGKYHESARRLLTAEINAAVEGMLEAGADDILIIDGHGGGAICFEELHPQAKLLHGKPLPRRQINDLLAKGFDAAMMIGQHAMCGIENGNLNHSHCPSSGIGIQDLEQVIRFKPYRLGIDALRRIEIPVISRISK